MGCAGSKLGGQPPPLEETAEQWQPATGTQQDHVSPVRSSASRHSIPDRDPSTSLTPSMGATSVTSTWDLRSFPGPAVLTTLGGTPISTATPMTASTVGTLRSPLTAAAISNRFRVPSVLGMPYLGDPLTPAPMSSTSRLRVVKVGGCTFVNQYLVVQYLGRGASGRVFLAMDVHRRRLVALKIVKKTQRMHSMPRMPTASRSATKQDNTPPSSSAVNERKPIAENSSNGAAAITPSTPSQQRLRRPGTKRDPLEDLRREVAIMRDVGWHDNIVGLLEVVDDPASQKMLIVMEYCEGGPVMTRAGLARERKVPEAVARSYFRDMVTGLAHLHECSVIHGDLKPENALMTAMGKVVLSDFGCSKCFGRGRHGGGSGKRVNTPPGSSAPSKMENGNNASNKTASASESSGLTGDAHVEDADDVMDRCNGTPAFLAPEMMKPGAKYRGRLADVYALGACLYTFIFGRIPFTASTVPELFKIVLSTELSFPKEVPISSSLRDLLSGMLCKDPSHRLSVQAVAAHAWTTDYGRLSPAGQQSTPVRGVTTSHACYDDGDVALTEMLAGFEGVEFAVYTAGQVLLRQGDKARVLLYIVDGEVEVLYRSQQSGGHEEGIEQQHEGLPSGCGVGEGGYHLQHHEKHQSQQEKEQQQQQQQHSLDRSASTPLELAVGGIEESNKSCGSGAVIHADDDVEDMDDVDEMRLAGGALRISQKDGASVKQGLAVENSRSKSNGDAGERSQSDDGGPLTDLNKSHHTVAASGSCSGKAASMRSGSTSGNSSIAKKSVASVDLHLPVGVSPHLHVAGGRGHYSVGEKHAASAPQHAGKGIVDIGPVHGKQAERQALLEVTRRLESEFQQYSVSTHDKDLDNHTSSANTTNNLLPVDGRGPGIGDNMASATESFTLGLGRVTALKAALSVDDQQDGSVHAARRMDSLFNASTLHSTPAQSPMPSARDHFAVSSTVFNVLDHNNNTIERESQDAVASAGSNTSYPPPEPVPVPPQLPPSRTPSSSASLPMPSSSRDPALGITSGAARAVPRVEGIWTGSAPTVPVQYEARVRPPPLPLQNTASSSQADLAGGSTAQPSIATSDKNDAFVPVKATQDQGDYHDQQQHQQQRVAAEGEHVSSNQPAAATTTNASSNSPPTANTGLCANGNIATAGTPSLIVGPSIAPLHAQTQTQRHIVESGGGRATIEPSAALFGKRASGVPFLSVRPVSSHPVIFREVEIDDDDAAQGEEEKGDAGSIEREGAYEEEEKGDAGSIEREGAYEEEEKGDAGSIEREGAYKALVSKCGDGEDRPIMNATERTMRLEEGLICAPTRGKSGLCVVSSEAPRNDISAGDDVAGSASKSQPTTNHASPNQRSINYAVEPGHASLPDDHEDDHVSALDLVEAADAATASLSTLARDHDYLLAVRGPGDFIGETALIGGSELRRSCTVRARSERVRVAVVPYSAAKSHFKAHPLAKQRLAEVVWARQSETIVLEGLLRLAKIKGQLAKWRGSGNAGL